MNEIRYMQASDAGRVAEIQVNAWKTAYAGIIPQPVLDRYNLEVRTVAWTKIISKSDVRDNVVVIDEKIMGWAGYGKCRDEDKNAKLTQELFGIYVDPIKFRCGYGEQLWQRARQEMLRHQPEEVTLWVLEENQRARAFYEENGFEADGLSKSPEWLQGALEIRMTLKIKK